MWTVTWYGGKEKVVDYRYFSQCTLVQVTMYVPIYIPFSPFNYCFAS